MLEFLAVNRGRRLPVKAVVTAALVEIRYCAIAETGGTDTDQSVGIEMQLRVFALKMNDIVPQTGKYPTAIWRFTRVPIRLCRCGDMWWVGWGRGIC